MIKKVGILTFGFLILIAIQFSCNYLLKILHMAFPSPLLGMIVLAVLLYFKIIPERLIKDICDLLLNNVSLFFVPLFVGIICYINIIQKNATPIIITVVFSTLLTMVITAFLVEGIIKLTEKKNCDD